MGGIPDPHPRPPPGALRTAPDPIPVTPPSLPENPGRSVLLVEDNPGERWLFSEIVRSRGHYVTACADAETGWKIYQEEHPPLVLLDWMLPGMSGLELCRLIRQTPAGDRSVVVVVTARDDPEALAAVLEAGADDYVRKPIDVGLMNVRLAVAEESVRVREERARSVQALEEKSREMEALLDNLDEVFFSIDVSRRVLNQVSPAAERVLGVGADELLGDPGLWRTLLYPEELSSLEPSLDSRTHERSITRRYPVHLRGGERRWLESRVKPTFDAEGTLVRIDGIVADVTEQKRSQEELGERNQELMTLYRLSEITLNASDRETAYRQILEEVSRSTGFPVALVELHDRDRQRMVIVAAHGLPEEASLIDLEIPLDRTLSGVAVRVGTPVVEADAATRVEHSHPALRRLNLRAWLSFPLVVGGEVVGTLTLADTTTAHPSPRLVRWAGSLANTVASYVESLLSGESVRESERRYRRLARELQQANAELQAFAYSVSHDLRAPLRTMTGFAHALLQDFGDSLPSQARDYVRRIIDSGRWSEDLIRDLLAYSRLTSEELPLERVSLAEVVFQAMDQLAGDVRQVGAQIEVEDEMPDVLAHHGALTQVVSNLLSNAVKFVAEGEAPRVRVGARAEGSRVRLSVEDNGIGVSPDQTERIFRVFERLAESGERPGTGIGLAIVRRAVERMGGSAGVEPRPGGGSTFWIELDRADGSASSAGGGHRPGGERLQQA